MLGLLWAFYAPHAHAEDGTEFVLILDNSCSMISTALGRPPADPQRQSVLGALVIDGLTSGTDDELTVLAMDLRSPNRVKQIAGYHAIRDLEDSGGTFYLGPLAEARKTLEASTKSDRILVFLSDGAPSDYRNPLLGPKTLGLDQPEVPFGTVIIGLLPNQGANAEAFLKPLALDPQDWVKVQTGNDLVEQFTQAYARSLGSKAITGTLGSGKSRSFRVGKYVTEVMVIAASTSPAGPWTAQLNGPDGVVPIKAQGDNGCNLDYANAPGLCDPPRMHFKVWRTSHDPLVAANYTLSVDRTASDVVYGVILRYDLAARIDVPSSVRSGEEVPVRAHLVWRGQRFDDAAFFDSDGFEAVAVIDGEETKLERQPGGIFTTSWTPTEPSSGVPIVVSAVFRNDWMRETADSGVLVEGYLDLTLRPHPNPLDFGSWRGERRATKRCLQVDLSGSLNADRIPLDVVFDDIPEDVVVTFTPVDMAQAGTVRERRQPLLWEACVEAVACCGDVKNKPTTALRLRGKPEHYHADAVTVPLLFEVEKTGFLRCWWPWLLALGIVLFVLFVLYGFLSPADFDEELTVKIAGSERQLARAASLVLREQPRGRRGFYRNARISVTAGGDFVGSPRTSAVWVEAQKAGETKLHMQATLERKDRRTRKWVPVEADEAADGIQLNVVYRVGNIFLRFQ